MLRFDTIWTAGEHLTHILHKANSSLQQQTCIK